MVFMKPCLKKILSRRKLRYSSRVYRKKMKLPSIQGIISWLKSAFVWLHHEIIELLDVLRPPLQSHFTDQGIDDICYYGGFVITLLILFVSIRLAANIIATVITWFIDLILKRSFHLAELGVVGFFSRVGRSLGYMLTFLLGGKSGRR